MLGRQEEFKLLRQPGQWAVWLLSLPLKYPFLLRMTYLIVFLVHAVTYKSTFTVFCNWKIIHSGLHCDGNWISDSFISLYRTTVGIVDRVMIRQDWVVALHVKLDKSPLSYVNRVLKYERFQICKSPGISLDSKILEAYLWKCWGLTEFWKALLAFSSTRILSTLGHIFEDIPKDMCDPVSYTHLTLPTTPYV